MTVFDKIFSACFVISTLLCRPTLQASSAEDDSYVAAVVEFSPAQFDNAFQTPAESVDLNLKGYLEILQSTDIHPADIIVFPEMTLNDNAEATLVPDPRSEGEAVAPCDEGDPAKYKDFLVQLSCEARRLSKYLVINVAERDRPLDEEECANDNATLYNTNVVFDRNGFVISRYRKIHLWNENRNASDTGDLGYFDTDFGVRFGHFVCFDILFYKPSQELVVELGIRDIIFPTMWFGQLPFLTSLQVQAAYAYANDLNLLAAGASYPVVGTTGTGIYAGRRGILRAVVSLGNGQRNVYVSQLKKKTTDLPSVTKRRIYKRSLPTAPSARRSVSSSEIFLKRDELEHYTTYAVDLENGTTLKKDLCFNGTFCCRFELEWQHLDVLPQTQYYNYRLGALDDWRKEAAPETNWLKNCAIFTCTGEDIMDCGKVFPNYVPNISPKVAFTKILIEASFPSSTQMLLMPNTLRHDLMPLNATDFAWEVVTTNGRRERRARLQLNTTTSDLMTFAIYGNFYDALDIKTSGKGAANQLQLYSGLLLLCLMVVAARRP